MEKRTYGKLNTIIVEDDQELGTAAAEHFAAAVNAELGTKPEMAVILALGASQLPFFAALKERSDIDWSRITVFHVDTYLGVSSDVPHSGASRLRRQLLDDVHPKAFYPLEGDRLPVEDELTRYSQLLEQHDPQVCLVGIGDTGHLAFNDPPADFTTPDLVQVVPLADETRVQIARAGLFASAEETPRYGLTLTMPALLRPATVLALVTSPAKAHLVHRVTEEPVSVMMPASFMQRFSNAWLYLTRGAAAELSDPDGRASA
ncbi:MAG: 6-phosphogluconolactonase [Propionicimonas sp.]|uniref:6-phosphogluconolactonase n=1 Tax=Propionicimonas sp. TaxID=1955623 RepID=UPI002B1FBEBB|nr:6-phosphogluconolactonase [Propionicimonas sp.]MEA4943192.1 6-phosphogluconolactonase [Propionicimonas sp.]